MSTQRSIAKSAGIIAGFTLLSRILGFFRDIVIAGVFGTGAIAQAFVVAFRIPNLIRELVGEGASNAAFVPVFSQYLIHKEKEEFWEAAKIILNLLFLFLFTLTCLGIIFSPQIVRLIAPGFVRDAAKLNLTIWLTRLLFPYLLFIGLTAYAIGVLNTFKSFAVPAFGPCLLNISLIVAVLFAQRYFADPVWGLVWGVLIGGILQLFIQIPSLYQKGLRITGLLWNLRHPVIYKVGRLLLPRAFGSAIYQLNVFIDTICASWAFVVGEGAVAAIYYANRVIQFPLAVFGIAISTASLPVMSQQVALKDMDKLKATVSFSLRHIFFIMLPVSTVLLLLSVPITRMLFERGSFDRYSSLITSSALSFYVFGLTAYAAVKVLSSCFYSLEDTVSPVKTAGLCLVVNLGLNLLLMWPLKVGGLALASSISATLNFFLLLKMLEKKIGRLDIAKIRSSFLRILLSSLVMGLGLAIFWQRMFFNLVVPLKLILAFIWALFLFLFGCLLFQVQELKEFSRWFSKK